MPFIEFKDNDDVLRIISQDFITDIVDKSDGVEVIKAGGEVIKIRNETYEQIITRLSGYGLTIHRI